MWVLSLYLKGFPGGLAGKESACTVGDLGSIPGLGISPREGKGYPLQYCAGEFHGRYSPWGHKELNVTEQLSLSLSRETEMNLQKKKKMGKKMLPKALFYALALK